MFGRAAPGEKEGGSHAEAQRGRAASTRRERRFSRRDAEARRREEGSRKNTAWQSRNERDVDPLTKLAA